MDPLYYRIVWYTSPELLAWGTQPGLIFFCLYVSLSAPINKGHVEMNVGMKKICLYRLRLWSCRRGGTHEIRNHTRVPHTPQQYHEVDSADPPIHLGRCRRVRPRLCGSPCISSVCRPQDWNCQMVGRRCDMCCHGAIYFAHPSY